jgi:hypothetical protein
MNVSPYHAALDASAVQCAHEIAFANRHGLSHVPALRARARRDAGLMQAEWGRYVRSLSQPDP